MYKGQERGKKDLLVLFTILKGKKKDSHQTRWKNFSIPRTAYLVCYIRNVFEQTNKERAELGK